MIIGYYERKVDKAAIEKFGQNPLTVQDLIKSTKKTQEAIQEYAAAITKCNETLEKYRRIVEESKEDKHEGPSQKRDYERHCV